MDLPANGKISQDYDSNDFRIHSRDVYVSLLLQRKAGVFSRDKLRSEFWIPATHPP